MEKLQAPIRTNPTRPTNATAVFAVTTWKNGFREYSEAGKYRKTNKTHAFTLVLVHCTPKLGGKLEGIDG